MTKKLWIMDDYQISRSFHGSIYRVLHVVLHSYCPDLQCSRTRYAPPLALSSSDQAPSLRRSEQPVLTETTLLHLEHLNVEHKYLITPYAVAALRPMLMVFQHGVRNFNHRAAD